MASKVRVNQLREAIAHHVPKLCIERAYWMTESYKETESELPIIRRAKALEKVLTGLPVHIEDGELIVGRATRERVAGTIIPEIQWEWYLKELEATFQPWTKEEKARLRGLLEYWNGKSLHDKWWTIVSENFPELERIFYTLVADCSVTGGFHLSHNCPGYERVLTGGLNGIKKRVDEELRKLELIDTKYFDKLTFLKSVNITLDAVVGFAKRYAELARSLANKETDIQRKAELGRIAETCDWVPANPARNFYEAMQSLWFAYIATELEGFGPGIGFGRMDQYLYPFYKKDIDEGRITREEAREIIGLFYIKMNELVVPHSSVEGGENRGEGEKRDNSAALPLSVITLGGVTPDGRDGVNELSYLFLEAETDIRLQEDIAVRIHKSTPEAFLVKACEVAKLLKGKFKFLSDETVIQQMSNVGKPIEYARDYAATGCFIHTVPGHSYDPGAGSFNLGLVLELALNNGVSRLTGKQMGSKTGDPKTFQSYEEVLEAYKKQVASMIRLCVITTNIYRQVFTELVPTPFQSALYDGCIEKGIDVSNNGTYPYVTSSWWVGGIPDVGDSLAAIKKVVFEDKRITMAKLIEVLDNNFEGEEEILKLLTDAPKFGNDDDYVDSIVNEVLVHVSNEFAKYEGFGGIKYTLAAGTAGGHVMMGKAVGALPEGRKAGESLADGGLSPQAGRDVNGPTSTLRSVTKLDLVKASGGAVLNMKFNPDVLKDESKMRNFVSLIRTFCETGGDLIQFNIVSSNTLRDAQKNPEQYRDLLVRVATFSAYFVELETEYQNQIIARTEFQEV